jgi:hypothetical protein
MPKQTIPDNVKKQVDEIVARFNHQVIKNPNYFYIPRYRGKYLYLNRRGFKTVDPICRLKYSGEIDNWGFAIYKYS